MSQQYCHCNGCRRYHSAPFIATVVFNTSDIDIVGGETECFKVNNSPDCTRLSCAFCRTPLINIPTHFQQFRSTFPMLFKEFDFQPQAHIWWSHRMIKSQIDDLPKFDGWPPM